MPQQSATQTALVTGAASGIGYELAHLLAKDSYSLILVDQDEQALQATAEHMRTVHHVDAVTVVQDLAQPGAAQHVYDAVQQQGQAVDVLINDAGFGESGAFLDTDLNRQVGIIQTNITALVELTYLFGRDMRQRGQGRILQLASLAAFAPAPYLGVYAATKSFVLSFSEALAYELRDSGVTVTALCPGATETAFFQRAHSEDTPAGASNSKADPKDVAKDGYEAMLRGDSRVISGAANKAQGFMTSFLPDTALAAIMSKQFEKQRPE